MGANAPITLKGMKEMKHIAIRKHFSCFTTDSKAIEGCEFDEKMDQLDDELRALFEKYGLTLLEQESRFIPMAKMSLCHCERCGHLMIDRDKNPARFDNDPLYSDLTFVVRDGGTHGGQVLCEACLPTSHRWGHFS